MNMMPNYWFYFEISFPDLTRKAIAYEVEQEFAIPFRPYDLCDDPVDAELVGGFTAAKAEICDKERRRLAERIAHDLAGHIMDAIKAKDTVNGYEQNTTGQGMTHKTEE